MTGWELMIKFGLYVVFKFIFSWRIIPLQYCVGFCHTSAWSSHRYTRVPLLLNLPPTSLPSHLSRWSQFPGLSSLHQAANPHWLSVSHVVVYVSFPLSICPTLSFPICVLKSMSASPCKWVHQYHLSRFHMHVCVCEYTIFVFLFLIYFTLYDRL